MAMIDNNHALCVHYVHPKASLIMWVELFTHNRKLALTRIWNLTCYLLEHKLLTLSLLVGRERNHHLFILLRGIENSIVQRNIELSSPGAPKFLSVDEPQTLFFVVMAGAQPDLHGPLRHEVARRACRTFQLPNLSVLTGTEQLQQLCSQGPGLVAFFLPLLHCFSIKLQNDNLGWVQWA